MSWDEAYANLAIYGLLQKNMPSANSTWGAFLRSKGLKRRAIPDDKPDDYTVEDFCREHPEGMYIVATEGHVLTVVDGDWWDSWDSSQEFPIFYYEQKSSGENSAT